MKTKMTDTGWQEITTVNINITEKITKSFMSVENWVKSNKKLNLFKKRSSCNCCKTGWEKITGDMYLIFTDKGNKSVCGECFKKLTIDN